MKRISKRRMRLAGLALVGLAVLLWLAAAAQAGIYHVYSCRTPAGESAPADGWSGSEVGAESHSVDTCSESGGALVAELGDGDRPDAGEANADWSFSAPTGEVIAAGKLWRAGDADGGTESNAGYRFTLAGPSVTSFFDSCLALSGCADKGAIGQPLSSENQISLPGANLGEHLYVSAACEGVSGNPCPSGVGDANHYAAVVYLYAADLTLEQTAGPTVSNVGGELASAPTVGGTSDVTFSATDPGSGVYEAVFSVDGQVVQSTVVNEDGGRCKNVGETTDGSAAFLYVQPCPASVGAAVGLDTTKLANGTHHLLVSVTDAAGNSAPVLDRTVNVYNAPAPGVPGPPNGTNASSQVTLTARWKSTRRSALSTPYGRSHTITGRLTTAGGAPIAGAQINVLATPSSPGARSASIASPHTDASGRFTLVLPRDISSSKVQIAYRAHLGDPLPVAASTLRLAVRAGIALKISPRTASAGSSIFFRGRLLGRPVPAEGKQLVLEARSPGGPWIEFKVVRTSARGRFRASYRFKFPGPAIYQFRARSEPESDYPFASGASNVVSVSER